VKGGWVVLPILGTATSAFAQTGCDPVPGGGGVVHAILVWLGLA
jgi:hypothetical protein